MRERLRPYIRKCMKKAHEKGTPIIRPLFYDIPEDAACWEIDDCYFFGPDLLVAPVTDAGVTTKEVYLPSGHSWTEAKTKKQYTGGQTVTATAAWDTIPVFIRDGKDIPVYK